MERKIVECPSTFTVRLYTDGRGPDAKLLRRIRRLFPGPKFKIESILRRLPEGIGPTNGGSMVLQVGPMYFSDPEKSLYDVYNVNQIRFLRGVPLRKVTKAFK